MTTENAMPLCNVDCRINIGVIVFDYILRYDNFVRRQLIAVRGEHIDKLSKVQDIYKKVGRKNFEKIFLTHLYEIYLRFLSIGRF